MKNNYSFGNIRFALENDHSSYEKDKLDHFRTDGGEPADYIIKVIPGDSICEPIRRGNTVTLTVRPENLDKIGEISILVNAKAAWLMLERSAFILHASYTVSNGRALLITAPSGTGKSTLAEHWINTVGGEIINGDRVLLRKEDGVWYAHGIYVSGTSGICKNVSAPLGAVVLLEQGQRNEIRNIRPHELFMRIVCQCSYDENDPRQCEQITSLVADLINENTACCYSCQNSSRAAAELEKLIWKKE